MAVTIKEVAALAGVSASTVSRVCNNNPSISQETQDRVRKAMVELGYEGYVPVGNAATQAIKMIGIILPPSERDAYENNFFLKVIRGISQICNQRLTASTVITGKDQEELLHSVKILHLSGRIDGFILLYSHKNDPVTEYLCEQGVLYVVVGKPYDTAAQTLSIDNDNLNASREATDYLYDLGHRKIGYLGSTNAFIFASERQAGYRLSLMLHDIPFRSDYCIEMDKANANAECLLALLSRKDRPTAFVVSEDMLALALERACNKLNLDIPNDLSIIAFNNSLYTQLSVPQLTAVDINSFQLGQEAALQIINYLENPNLLPNKIIVPHQIVPGGSCKAIK